MNPSSLLSKSRRSGSILIPTVLILAIASVFVGIAFKLTGNVGRFTDRNMTRQKAMAIADGALELQFAQWCAILQYGVTFAPPSSEFDNISLPKSSMFPWVPNFTATRNADTNYVVSNYKIYAVDPLDTPLPVNEKPTMISTNNAGINIYHYLATVDVTLPSRSGPVTVRMGRIFQLQNRSPWTYAIFSDGDLEINPGAPMTITGDVRTNGDLYVGAGGSPITFNGRVAVSGTMKYGSSPSDPTTRGSQGNVTFSIAGQPKTGVETETPLGIAKSSLDPSASNKNDDSYHEVIEAPVTPESSNPDPFSPQGKQTARFYNMADYKITVSNSSGNVTEAATISVLNANNQPFSTTTDLYKVLVQGGTIGGKSYTAVLNTTGTMRDARENATMRLTTVNVGALKEAVDAGIIPAKDAGLLFYINDSREAKTVSGKLNEPAVKVDNGNILPANGLTIVSGNPVYIEGDYNTGQNSPSNLGSNQTAGGSPTKSNYWEPAAIIGDAITVLSNNWTPSSTSSSKAAATTINAAFMAGSMASNGDDYSGGIENFPRFLENWSGIRFTYYGSMVWLFESKQADEPWGSSGVYSAPTRYWNYEKKFYAKTPPGVFMVLSYQKLRWFLR